jgi:predicted DNA-binding transcriptional regulator YafY
LLALLLLLQTRGRMTAQELAAELEVSVRTVYRDVESLGASGVPVYADRGPTGGYQLLDGYRTRLTGLSADEAESLFLAGLPGPAAELGLGTVLATAELKLLAALPPQLRDRAGRLRERFHLDPTGWFYSDEQTPHLAAVAAAIWEQRAIRVRYLRAGRSGEVTRMLEPLGVVLKGGAWYLVARASGQDRTYRVGRILELEPLNQHFERPERFDLANFWETWSESFEARMYRGEAVIKLSPRGREMLPYLAAPAVNRAVEESADSPDRDGWVRATIPIESREHASGELLRLGAGVEVLAPLELRARIAETVASLARLYQEAKEERGLAPASAARASILTEEN